MLYKQMYDDFNCLCNEMWAKMSSCSVCYDLNELMQLGVTQKMGIEVQYSNYAV